ncbi:MAG: acyl carrier protein [Kofleriaceae bacterium]
MTEARVVLQQLDTYIRTTFHVAPDDPEFGNDVHLFDHGYLDSFSNQELIAHIESTYQIKIRNEDLVKYRLNTLNEISSFIADRQAGVR